MALGSWEGGVGAGRPEGLPLPPHPWAPDTTPCTCSPAVVGQGGAYPDPWNKLRLQPGSFSPGRGQALPL